MARPSSQAPHRARTRARCSIPRRARIWAAPRTEDGPYGRTHSHHSRCPDAGRSRGTCCRRLQPGVRARTVPPARRRAVPRRPAGHLHDGRRGRHLPRLHLCAARALRGERRGRRLTPLDGLPPARRWAARGREHPPRHLRERVQPRRRWLPPVRGPGGWRGVPLHQLRAVQRPLAVPLLRPARHQGPLHTHGDCSGALGTDRQRAAGPHRVPPGRPQAGAVRAHPGVLHLPLRPHRWPVRGVPRPVGGRAARVLCAEVARPLRGSGRAVRGHAPWHGVLLPLLRLRVPVRQVRPGLRAGVQRRRDGERGRGDAHGAPRLPRPADRHRPPRPRRGHPARDGPHVVREPRHDALVERPVAERIVRHVHVLHGPRGRDALHQRLAGVQRRHEELGLHPGRADHDASDLWRRPRHRRDLPQLRWHHLRQGRIGHQAARRRHRRAGLPGGNASLLQTPRVQQHDDRGLARRARRRRRPGPAPVGSGVAGDRLPQHDRRERRGGRRAHRQPHADAERVRRTPDPAPPHAGGRPAAGRRCADHRGLGAGEDRRRDG